MALVPIIEDLTSQKIVECLKLNIPIVLYFYDETMGESIEHRVAIISRETNTNCKITLGKSNFIKIISYTELIKHINQTITSGLSFKILCEKTYLTTHKPLIDMLGKYNPELINSVKYIDYDKIKSYYEIRNNNLSSGASDVIYYFENNNSILSFSENGPSLFIPETVNNILDIIG